MGFTNSSAPSTQVFLHKTDSRQATADMYARGSHLPEANTTVNFGYGKARKTSSPVSSLSPPQSSVTGELPSQLSLEYLCDSDSHQRDLTCTQAYTRSHVASVYGHAESPESVQQNASLSFAPVDNHSMKNVLEELESALLGPDGDGAESVEFSGDNNSFWTELLDEVTLAMQLMASDNTPNTQALSTSHGAWQSVYQPSNPSSSEHSLQSVLFSQGSRVTTLLAMCAFAIGENRLDTADAVMQELRKEVSVLGDPAQRLAAYMSEGLVARMHASGFALYRALKCMDAPAADVLSAMQKLYEICPYFKFAYMAANGAIAEVFKNEAKVHIFDFQIVQGTQWVSLMQGLANRPGGPPCIRITTVEDPSAQGYPIGGMQLVRQRLSKLAESLKVPFEFNTIPCKLSELKAHMIERREGEALAVNFTLQLHHLPDESVSVENPRDRTLRVARELNPKVLTVVEQEANTNTTPFFTRFIEVLNYYTSIFESIDVVLPRESKDRVTVEEQCLARDIVNVIACEGTERVERLELTGKWRARLSMAGFRPHPLSSYVNDTIKMLLQSYSDNYTLKEEGGALFLGWCNRPLVVATAWH
ncbi:hypothetical protein L7F22_008434 [Adiantum nelumboides]|nr:hypothetical protein [Adiantum nelumboides]